MIMVWCPIKLYTPFRCCERQIRKTVQIWEGKNVKLAELVIPRYESQPDIFNSTIDLIKNEEDPQLQKQLEDIKDSPKVPRETC